MLMLFKWVDQKKLEHVVMDWCDINSTMFFVEEQSPDWCLDDCHVCLDFWLGKDLSY